jgi:hypothetical protein
LELKQHVAGLVADFDRVEKSTVVPASSIIDAFESVEPTADRVGRDQLGARDALNRLRSVRKPR